MTLGLCVRRAVRRASCSNTSDSVVFARLFPVLFGVWTDATAGEAGAGAGGAGGAMGSAVDAGGAEGALIAAAGGVGAKGFVELGRLVQASSSNPLIAGAAELARGGEETEIGEVVMLGLEPRVNCSDAVVRESRSTVAGGVDLLG